MQTMLQVCERYAADHNLFFSTDPEPSKSKSKCVYMCVWAARDRVSQATTGKNMTQIERDTGLDPWRDPAWKIRAAVPREEVPDGEHWRAQYLSKLILTRRNMKTNLEDTTDMDNLIDSLCSS